MATQFLLFVTGESARSARAEANLRVLADLALDGAADLEVCDVESDPARADEWQVMATPTVVRISPAPQRRAVGDFSDLGQLATAMDVHLPRARERDGVPGASG